MRKFLKFLLGAAVVAATVAGVFYFLKKNSDDNDFDEFDDYDDFDDFDDFIDDDDEEDDIDIAITDNGDAE